MLLIAVWASPALAIDPDIAAYNRCVADQAVRLSIGSDAADLIAKNAAILCGQILAKLFEGPRGMTGAQATAFENHAVSEATIAVLEARAKK
jgi:hypothetical protein